MGNGMLFMSDCIGGAGLFGLDCAVFTVSGNNRHDYLGGIRPHLENIGTRIYTETTGNTEIRIDKNFHLLLRYEKKIIVSVLVIIIQRK
jgi:hypothetical protein